MMYNYKREVPRPRYKCPYCDGVGGFSGLKITIAGAETGIHGCYACGGKGDLSFASFEYYNKRKPIKDLDD